jgi:hypothetical protein
MKNGKGRPCGALFFLAAVDAAAFPQRIKFMGMTNCLNTLLSEKGRTSTTKSCEGPWRDAPEMAATL